MSSIGTGYDLSAHQFSPDGRVFQIEYAQKAVENSGTAIALKGKDGVVFAVERIVQSKLYENSCNQRISHVDQHIGLTTAGLYADARHLVETARDEARDYRNRYGISIPTKYLADRLSLYIHAHTLYGALRPFGCTVIVGGYDKETGPQLFMTDPSGVCFGYKGCAAGKAKQNAKTEIEKLKMTTMPCTELVKQAAKIIYSVHDEVKDKNFELELSWVGEITGGKHMLVSQAMFDDAEKYAKAQLEESDSDEDM